MGSVVCDGLSHLSAQGNRPIPVPDSNKSGRVRVAGNALCLICLLAVTEPVQFGKRWSNITAASGRATSRPAMEAPLNHSQILGFARGFVLEELGADSSGRDAWHAQRVARTARRIAELEGADAFICELAALLHDIADEKIQTDGLAKVEDWLQRQKLDHSHVLHVLDIIATMSFRGGGQPPMRTLEGRVVQDADRLDALGAVGIARVFAYAGATGQALHDPDLPVRSHMTATEYRHGRSTAINHFYEKLLQLKDLMNTDYGRRWAANRHHVMEAFLTEFYAEWEGLQ